MTSRAARRMATPLIFGAVALAVAGCETIGNPISVIRGDRSTPDEFAVLARKPLRMPGNLDLPEPRLGEVSPLEPDARGAAIVALLGSPAVTDAGPGVSPGEQALLSAANAGASNPEVEADLVAAEQRAEANTEYEPPTLVELLSQDGDTPEDAIDPAAEARRLQVEGLAPAPVDPTELPPGTAPDRTLRLGDEASDETEVLQRRPSDVLPSSQRSTF